LQNIERMDAVIVVARNASAVDLRAWWISYKCIPI
jgi:hypothetical protein